MRFRYLHIADVHLGYQQYGLIERFQDFHTVWQEAVTYALDTKVDFVLIAGDLFEKRNTDPLAFEQAQSELLRLQRAEIPVLAIEGNHDRYIHNREHSWLRVLASQGALMLLDVIDEYGQVALQPYDTATQRGGYVDLPSGVRVLGLRYRGERLGRDVAVLQGLLETQEGPEAPYRILMCHTGIQEETEFPAGRGYIHLPQLEALSPHVDYIAVGHIHYAKRCGDLVFQPGSLENCSSEEAQRPHGFYVVEVDTETSPKHQVTLVETKKRPFLLLSFLTDSYDNSEELLEGIKAYLNEEAAPKQAPLIELSLEGILSFPRFQLDTKSIEGALRERFAPLHVRIKNNCAKRGEIALSEEHQTREELEAQVMREVLREGMQSDKEVEPFAQIALELKQMALKREDADAIIEVLDRAIEIQTAEGETP